MPVFAVIRRHHYDGELIGQSADATVALFPEACHALDYAEWRGLNETDELVEFLVVNSCGRRERKPVEPEIVDDAIVF